MVITVKDLLGLHFEEFLRLDCFSKVSAKVEILDGYRYIKFISMGLNAGGENDTGTVQTIWLANSSSSANTGVTFLLPHGVSLGMSRKEIYELLGQPSKQGPTVTKFIQNESKVILKDKEDEIALEAILKDRLKHGDPHWDCWNFETHSIHFEYDNTQRRISMATIFIIPAL